jgi:hypothetical protein
VTSYGLETVGNPYHYYLMQSQLDDNMFRHVLVKRWVIPTMWKEAFEFAIKQFGIQIPENWIEDSKIWIEKAELNHKIDYETDLVLGADDLGIFSMDEINEARKVALKNLGIEDPDKN